VEGKRRLVSGNKEILQLEKKQRLEAMVKEKKRETEEMDLKTGLIYKKKSNCLRPVEKYNLLTGTKARL
jgi:hypothetical protein